MRENDQRKQGLAWLMRSSTVVSADWVVWKLALGSPSNVSRAMRAIPGAEEKEAVKIRRQWQAGKNELHEGKDTFSEFKLERTRGQTRPVATGTLANEHRPLFPCPQNAGRFQAPGLGDGRGRIVWCP